MDIGKIERMSPADLDEVTVLAAQLGYPNSVDNIRARFSKIQDSQDYGLFVAKAGTGKILGYVQINLEPSTLLAAPRADVAALIVDERERSKGAGTALLTRAEHWARERGLSLIRIRSNIKRENAHRFYQRNGYEISKSSHVLTKSLT